jgi:hypothetical protein
MSSLSSCCDIGAFCIWCGRWSSIASISASTLRKRCSRCLRLLAAGVGSRGTSDTLFALGTGGYHDELFDADNLEGVESSRKKKKAILILGEVLECTVHQNTKTAWNAAYSSRALNF